ncbi:MAG: D-TA family PLP-dependent enzyme [Candidatus Poribacteria bacterium]|nr:D-TA family PLP-dependent enzyme [Candidatus Poribacteria bacterium]
MYDWRPVENLDDVFTPALLFDVERIKFNMRRAVEMVGGETHRLRPHVKTHKCPEIVQLALSAGIFKHKCATLREAQMLAECGAEDVLIAYQMVGPNAGALARLIAERPETRFSSVVDDLSAARGLNSAAERQGVRVDVWIDLDVGMGRTGIAPDERAVQLCRQLRGFENLRLRGLHAYDGHNRVPDVDERRRTTEKILEVVRRLRGRLERIGFAELSIVAGGAPPFPFYAVQSDVEASPGTFALHDYGYSSRFPDLGFAPAAALATRIISRPRPNIVCVDLGHKAIAADPSGARGVVLNLPDAEVGPQSEEHWTIRIPPHNALPRQADSGSDLKVGDALYICPTHICPTVALHNQALTVENGIITGAWQIERERLG